MFVTRSLYLISDDSHEDYWNIGINVFELALASHLSIVYLCIHTVPLKDNVVLAHNISSSKRNHSIECEYWCTRKTLKAVKL